MIFVSADQYNKTLQNINRSP